jgi:DNA processing protein
MIQLEELFLILFEAKLNLKTQDTLNLYQSLHQNEICLYPTQLTKLALLKNFYNQNWLKEKQKIVQEKIKFWQDQHNIKTLCINNPKYPHHFLKLKNPPVCIFIKGTYHSSDFNLSIVGRREAKSYTLKWMEDQLSPVLKELNPMVISGGARGVDTKAHQTALMNNCKTLYLMPSGLLNLYPENLKTKEASLIQAGACFMSAYPPDHTMRKQNFSDRNLLIAALSQKILILEAEIRSGTYKTAKYAIDLGCDLGVVPSFPSDLSYSGSLQLIYDGAQMIRDSKDLKQFMSF